MLLEERTSLQSFWCIGISYHNTSAEVRSRFAISTEAYEHILAAASDYGVSSLFVLSTCNRTEVYGIAKDSTLLKALLCRFTEGEVREFKEIAYVKNATLAIQHIFNVAAGIDSQILGDYEIVGQLKTAFNFAKERGATSAFIDRLFSTVLQSSRAIRSKTELSSGTVSVAYAAVQFIKEHYAIIASQKVLVVGTGDIGRNSCKNLQSEFEGIQLAIVNRTEENAKTFAAELGIQWKPFAELQEAVDEADIIIVATNALEPIIVPGMIKEGDFKTIIDLSIPNNVSPELGLRANITLANVDDLSKINDETLKRREEEVPKAKGIISYYVHEFAEWYLMRQNVPVLKAAKEKIKELNGQLGTPEDFESKDFGQKVQKVLNTMAMKLKEEKRPGCTYLEAMYNYVQITPGATSTQLNQKID